MKEFSLEIRAFRRETPVMNALLSILVLLSSPALADQVVQTGIPGGDGKALLEHSKPEDAWGHTHGAILVHDRECSKKVNGEETLQNGKPNPEYVRCVHEKVEKAKKTGEH
jgi:hypothetical protein